MPHTVLVVDDDPVMHSLMEYHLERAGYQMLTASNGREAIEVASRALPQLIILDIAMPQMGGVTALRHLKQTEATKAIPVIVVTVHTDAATQRECELAGAAAFLSKPLNPAQLNIEMKRQLAGHRAAGEAGQGQV
jgi:CheY-like chemotaxis protein